MSGVGICKMNDKCCKIETIRCWTPSQNTLILLNKNPKIYESVLDKEVNIGQKAYDFPMVSQAAVEN